MASAPELGFRPPYPGTVVDATKGKQPDGFRHEPDGDTLKTPEKTLPISALDALQRWHRHPLFFWSLDFLRDPAMLGMVYMRRFIPWHQFVDSASSTPRARYRLPIS